MSSLSGVPVAITHLASFQRWMVSTALSAFLDRPRVLCYSTLKSFVVASGRAGKVMPKNSKAFDIIVLAGMVVNLILAVFLLLYYFDFL